MKILNIIKENRQFDDALAKKIESLCNCNRVSVSTGDYAGGRPDSDPLKGKSYGKVTFLQKQELEDDDWSKVTNYLKSLGFEIVEDSNFYDFEPGERDYYPTIKFHFTKK